jgi:hypothetical protein
MVPIELRPVEESKTALPLGSTLLNGSAYAAWLLNEGAGSGMSNATVTSARTAERDRNAT